MQNQQPLRVIECLPKQGSKSDNMIRLYELDDNPDRRLFLDKLLHYMEERGTPLTQCPTISKQPLDLYRLYHYTKERGGYLEVSIDVLVVNEFY